MIDTVVLVSDDDDAAARLADATRNALIAYSNVKRVLTWRDLRSATGVLPELTAY